MTVRKIYNTPNNYEWGSKSLIPKFLDVEPDGNPQAEIWLGTHPISSALYSDSQSPISNDVELNFLVKVLASEKPLSIQVHPTLEAAIEGFKRENDMGVPLDSSMRNYKDSNHKPEMIIAIENGFRALCGFRDTAKSVRVLRELLYLSGLTLAHLEAFIGVIIENGNDNIDKTVGYIFKDSNGDMIANDLTSALSSADINMMGADLDVLYHISRVFPNDLGIAMASLMNYVVLRKGEALFLGAGNVHAYINGIGVEVMASSDNVIRGGLTPKHIDTVELMNTIDFKVISDVVLNADESNGYKLYQPIEDFSVLDVENMEVELNNRLTVMVALSDGKIEASGEAYGFVRGESFLVEAESVQISGHAILAQ